jgi:hypothetical protein
MTSAAPASMKATPKRLFQIAHAGGFLADEQIGASNDGHDMGPYVG